MTARATFTQAQIARAIAAADRAGKVALYTPQGIAFVPPDYLRQTDKAESGAAWVSADDVFTAGISCDSQA